MLSHQKKSYTNLESILESRDTTLPTKVHYSQSYDFSSSHVWMRELNCNEGWAPKKWCFGIVVLEKTFESPLDHKEIQLVNSKGIQPWIFIGRTDAEAEPQFFGHLMWRADSLEKILMLGKTEGKRRRGSRGWDGYWHHWLNGHEFEQILGDDEGQRNWTCCSPRGCNEWQIWWRNNSSNSGLTGVWKEKFWIWFELYYFLLMWAWANY